MNLVKSPSIMQTEAAVQQSHQHTPQSTRQPVWALIIVACLLLWSHTTLWNGQFGGEDETMQLDYATRMIQGIRHLDIQDFFRALASQAHPPLRYWLSIPGLLLFPNSELGLRLGAILFSFYMVYQVMQLGREIGGTTVGVVSGVLLAVSPVYNWTSIAFGWSVIVVTLVHSIRLLRSRSTDISTPEGKRTYAVVNLLVIVAFLINTGCVLFFVSTSFIYFVWNRHQLSRLIKISLPFVLFFVLYYAVYLFIVPYVGANYFGITTPIGQYAHNVGRAGQSYLNYTSLLENLGGINAYFFPYVAWILLACALYYPVRYEWAVAVWLSPFTLIWSFYLTNQSHQYFLLVFIAILPYGLKVPYDLLGRRPFVVAATALAMLMALWNYQIYMRPYGGNDPDYPTALIALGNAHVGRVHNITEPYTKIGHDIDGLLGDDETFIHDIAGAFTAYYYPTQRYAGQFGTAPYSYEFDTAEQCYRAPRDMGQDMSKVRAIVTTKEICAADVQERITYANSAIKLFLLHEH